MEYSICQNCGRQMKNPSDFGGRILSNRFCSDCTDSLGNRAPFNEAIHSAKTPAKRENLVFWIKLKYLQLKHRRYVRKRLKSRGKIR